MAWSETLNYVVVKSELLSPQQHEQINDLLTTSIAIDYPDITRNEHSYFVDQSARYRSNPNLAVGGRTIAAHQTFARSVNILAYDGETLVANLPAADNASSRLPGFLGVPERDLKLYSEHLVGKRWLWLGLAALNAQAREDQMNCGDTQPTVVDGLYAGAIRNRLDRQPLSTYPYAAEHDWKSGLARAGFLPTEDSQRNLQVFGPSSELTVCQETWTAPSVQVIRDHIVALEGGKQLLQRVKESKIQEF